MTTSPGGPSGRPDSERKTLAPVQKVDRQAALAALRQPTEPSVDLHEMSPVMATFREHLAREQEQNRRRVGGLVTGFAVALLVVALVPVYLARQLADSTDRQIAAQREAQDAQAKLAKSVADGMSTLATSSQLLREELLKERQLLSAAVTAAPPTLVITTVVPVTVTAPAPGPAPVQTPVVAQPLPMAPPAATFAPITSLGSVTTPAASPKKTEPVPTPVPVAAVRDLNDNDLTNLLKKVEQDIKARRTLLDHSRPANRPN